MRFLGRCGCFATAPQARQKDPEQCSQACGTGQLHKADGATAGPPAADAALPQLPPESVHTHQGVLAEVKDKLDQEERSTILSATAGPPQDHATVSAPKSAAKEKVTEGDLQSAIPSQDGATAKQPADSAKKSKVSHALNECCMLHVLCVQKSKCSIEVGKPGFCFVRSHVGKPQAPYVTLGIA